MSKGKKKGSGGGSSSTIGSNSRNLIIINPNIVYFTHSRVRPQFTGCNKVIADTIQEIVEGRTRISDIPMITVIENDGHYFSLNNRRLFMFKELCKMGLIPAEGIQCFIKPALERERERYTPSRCSLRAKLMGGNRPEKKSINGEDKDEGDEDGNESSDAEEDGGGGNGESRK